MVDAHQLIHPRLLSLALAMADADLAPLFQHATQLCEEGGGELLLGIRKLQVSAVSPVGWRCQRAYTRRSVRKRT